MITLTDKEVGAVKWLLDRTTGEVAWILKCAREMSRNGEADPAYGRTIETLVETLKELEKKLEKSN